MAGPGDFSRNHNFVLCPNEIAVRLDYYVKGHTMLEDFIVHGTTNKIKRSTTKASRDPTKGINILLYEMHQHKFTFGGEFTAENLYVTEGGKIKVDPSMVSALKPFTDQNSEDDYITAADIIEDIIFAGEKDLPEDICHLIKLMKYESTQFEYVIRCHISSLDSRSQLDHFSWMFKRLDFLELSDPQKYDDIVKKIPYGQGQWKQMVKGSKLLQSIYDYKKRQSTFEDSGKGLVSLGRNSVEHLT